MGVMVDKLIDIIAFSFGYTMIRQIRLTQSHRHSTAGRKVSRAAITALRPGSCRGRHIGTIHDSSISNTVCFIFLSTKGVCALARGLDGTCMWNVVLVSCKTSLRLNCRVSRKVSSA